MFRITQLARQFGLSRSTLLYYDRIGLLSPSGRSETDYRLYSPADRDRLERICTYRNAGLTVADIRALLAMEGDDTSDVLQHRLKELGETIRDLQSKQRLLAGMLSLPPVGPCPPWTRKHGSPCCGPREWIKPPWTAGTRSSRSAPRKPTTGF